MTTFILAVVIFGLLGFIGWLLYEQRVDRERLINRLLAKTASEVRVLDNEPRRVDKSHPVYEPSPEEREFWADFSGQTGI